MLNFSISKYNNKKTGLSYFYALPQFDETVSTRQLARQIARECTVSLTDVIAVLQSVGEIVCSMLSQGKRVKLDGLGMVAVRLKQNSTTSRDDFSASCIKGATAVLHPSDELNNVFNGMQLNFVPSRKDQKTAKQAAKAGAKLAVKE